ncbi:hypothetical protein LTR86_010128 [Recurvomyces mirabilis]|nr:hypothetical protein LTR86_010128 [Recurvomyces mirabilis]
MVVVHLPQGSYEGGTQGNVNYYHGIPYAQPFERFKSPKPVTKASTLSGVQDATKFGPICPQNASRLEPYVYGRWPTPPDGGHPDESNCCVLSVYQPESAAQKSGQKLPVIVYMHGGAWQTGSSEINWYTGTALARDGNCVVVTISYRVGILGYMYHQGKELACGTEDHILALEWVRANIESFGGDSGNITASGQSAGAYNTQLLLDLRPDLFERAIIMSSPANTAFTVENGNKIAEAVNSSLPSGQTPQTASVTELLQAQAAASVKVGGLAQFAPIIADGMPPGGRHTVKDVASRKDVWVTWKQHDGSAFAALTGGFETKASDELSVKITDDFFKNPAIELAQRLAKAGHKVATLEHQWSPEGFQLGATHCLDLPLVLGDAEAWKVSPMRGKASNEEWERRGAAIRRAFGQFARTGEVPEVLEGTEIKSIP